MKTKSRKFLVDRATCSPIPILISACVLFATFRISLAEKAKQGLFFSQSIGASYDPLGLLLDSRLLYRVPLVNKPGILWESTKLDAGIQNEWTPADNVASGRIELEPAAFCSVVCKAGYYNLFNELGYGCYRLDSPSQPYGPQAQKSMKPASAQGYWVSVAPTLKAQLWRIIVLNTATVSRLSINGSGYFLEVRSYLPHRTTDVDVINDAFVLAQCSPWLLAGATYRYAYVKDASVRSQRACALAIVKPTSGALKGAFAAVEAGAYFQDPFLNRTVYVGCAAGVDFRLANCK